MTSNLELYGTEDVPPIPAKVADDRIELLNKHLKALLAMPYKVRPNITPISNAIDFWEKLKQGKVL